MLVGKNLTPPPRIRKVDATETISQEDHDAEYEEDEWQEIDIMNLAMKEGMKAAAKTAKKPRS